MADSEQATSAAFIPVVDMWAVRLAHTAHEHDVQRVAHQLHTAFSTIGFVYVTNHGLDWQQIDTLNDVTEKFFCLSTEEKNKFLRSKDEYEGYSCLEQEKLSADRPGDYKQAYDVSYNCSWDENTRSWPDALVPGFRDAFHALMTSCKQLTDVILTLMAVALKLENREYFVKHHSSEKNISMLRTLYYPPMPEGKELKAGQTRCAEHTDYGSITLLFQDDVKGLEVMNLQGEYQMALPVPGAVVVNIGDLMQRWTSDKLVSTMHRVLIPEDETARKKARRSIAYFAQPDDDALIQCLDGSTKYQPIKGGDYLHQRFAETY